MVCHVLEQIVGEIQVLELGQPQKRVGQRLEAVVLQHQPLEAHELAEVVRQPLQLIVLKVEVDHMHQVTARQRGRPREVEQVGQLVSRHKHLHE